MRPLGVIASLSVVVGACTSILDFDGYQYVEGGAGAVGGAATSSANGGSSTSGTAGSAGAGAACANDMQDPGETDIDCGGATCPGCNNGQGCQSDDDCLSYNCFGTTCGPCTDEDGGNCPSGTYCSNADICEPLKSNGTPCSSNQECLTDACDDDICCDVDCSGTCRSCIGGTCTLSAVNTDPDTECATDCNGMGMCLGCNTPLVPPGGGCPGACNGGCTTTPPTCTINCTGASPCTTVVCPSGYDCVVSCNGSSACEDSNGNAQIDCPVGYSCQVVCSGSDACKDADVNCGQGTCEVVCQTNSACDGTTVHCGDELCTCQANGVQPPYLDCGASCGCEPC